MKLPRRRPQDPVSRIPRQTLFWKRWSQWEQVAPVHHMNDLERMSLEYTDRCGGELPFRFSVGPDQVLFYVFVDSYRTNDREAAIIHMRELVLALREASE